MKPNVPAAVVQMYPLTSDYKAFDVMVYGVTATSLMTVPNSVIRKLAEKYGDTHTSSPFALYDHLGWKKENGRTPHYES